MLVLSHITSFMRLILDYKKNKKAEIKTSMLMKWAITEKLRNN